ncbi:MAG: peroxiredoxin [Deltaproteobacteria bacterium]|nr:peroxiredoxin [Nannocystaceae bacterium]
MTIEIGQRIPAVKFKRVLADGSVVELDTAEEFAGKQMILVGVPGAYTPTCSKEHLPSYVAHADELRAKGVGGIVCMATNDHFVMRAWADEQEAEGKVDMLADGNGELTRALGLEVDLSGYKLGPRCKRFVAKFDDGVLSSLDIETGGGISETGAEACLARL